MAKDDDTKARRHASSGNGTAAALGSNSEIGRKLKQYYDELIVEDVPDRFTSLLRQLEESEQAGPTNKKDPA